MKLDPTATQDTNDFPLIPEGTYDFQVENATKFQAKSGNLCWKVQLRIDMDGGRSSKVWENLVETAANQWKFNQYFKSVGMMATDTDDMPKSIGEIGKCFIGIEPARNGYKAKNTVKRFIEKEPEELPF